MGYLKLSNGYAGLHNGYLSIYGGREKDVKESVRDSKFMPVSGKALVKNPLIAVPNQPQLMYNEYKGQDEVKKIVRKKAMKLGKML